MFVTCLAFASRYLRASNSNWLSAAASCCGCFAFRCRSVSTTITFTILVGLTSIENNTFDAWGLFKGTANFPFLHQAYHSLLAFASRYLRASNSNWLSAAASCCGCFAFRCRSVSTTITFTILVGLTSIENNTFDAWGLFKGTANFPFLHQAYHSLRRDGVLFSYGIGRPWHRIFNDDILFFVVRGGRSTFARCPLSPE